MKVRIIQLLCPARHCIVATVYESPDGRKIPEKQSEMAAAFANSGINSWCGICGSRELTYEDQPTIFTSMEQALPRLREHELNQLLTRKAIHSQN